MKTAATCGTMLHVTGKVIGYHVLDVARVHVARRDVPGRDQVAEHCAAAYGSCSLS